MMSPNRNFFHLDDLAQGASRTLSEGIEARIFCGEHAMLSILKVEPHAASSLHSHPEEQWGILLRGSGVRFQDGMEHPVSAGDFWRTPSNTPHSFRADSEGALLVDVFAPPREEYRTPGQAALAGQAPAR